MSKKKFRFNYRRNLAVTLIFLQFLTVAIILILSRANIDQVMVTNAYNSMAQKIAQSVDHTQAFLEPAYQTNETLITLANNNVLNFNDTETVEKIFFTELLNNSNFAGIYIANNDGDFIYMRRKNDNTVDEQNKKFETKIIQHHENVRSVTLRWHNEFFTLVGQKKDPTDAYNPKERPWYTLAIDANETSWTEPYTFFTSKKPGITISTPYQNKHNQHKGVIGIDIETHELSSFLNRINIDDYYIRINDNKNNLIAETSNDVTLTDKKLQNIELQTPDPSSISRGTFEHSNEEYLYVYKNLKLESDNRKLPAWNVFTSAKTSPFLLETRDIEKRNIFIAIHALLISIILSIFIARKTSKPVEGWMKQATTDSLTYLYNRRTFFNIGDNLYSEYIKRKDHNLASMMIDLDDLKLVNDKFGHHIGDETLKVVANCLKSGINDEALLARFGGDEFILLTKVDSTNQAMQLAENLRHSIENLEIQTPSKNIKVTVSIGVTLTNHDIDLTFQEFINVADKALYEAKNSGRNKVKLIN